MYYKSQFNKRDIIISRMNSPVLFLKVSCKDSDFFINSHLCLKPKVNKATLFQMPFGCVFLKVSLQL